MNEKVYELLDTVQKTAAQAGAVAADAAYGVSKKAEELLSTAKQRSRLAGLEGDRDAALAHVGRMVYATHTGTLTDTDALLEKLREIDGLLEEITALREELGYSPEAPVCPVCGSEGENGDQFCRDCGGKL